MNFEHMPELRSPFGYPIAFVVTVLLTATMWWWCKRKRWI
jgi:magnesium transporter